MGDAVPLYLNGKMIIAVKLASGKVYYWRRSLLGPLLGLLPCIVLGVSLTVATRSIWGALAGLAFYGFVFGGDIKQVVSMQPKFAEMGGTPIQS